MEYRQYRQAVEVGRGRSSSPAGSGIVERVRSVPLGWVLRDVLIPWAATHLMFVAVAMIAMKFMPLARHAAVWDGSSRWWINMWSRWDAFHYLSIAREGYIYAGPDQTTNVGFSPLLPLLMRLVGSLVGRMDDEGLLIAGIILTNIALLIALCYFVLLVRLDFDAATASRTAFYLLIFPTSLFLSAVYADSLLLALTIAAFYHARRGQWWIVGVAGGLASLTRPYGVSVVVPLAFEYLYQRRFHLRAIRWDVLALGLIPAIFVVWGFYMYRLTGEPLFVLAPGAAWGRKPTPPWTLLGTHVSLLDLGFTLIFLVLVLASWRLVRPSYALLANLFFLISISSGYLMSLNRYGLTMFPVFMVLAIAGRHPLFDRVYVAMAAGLAGLFMGMFALWFWVG